jgi:hypothetical protein
MPAIGSSNKGEASPAMRPIIPDATRPKIKPFSRLVEGFIWHGDGYRDGKVFPTHGVFYVRDLYQTR